MLLFFLEEASIAREKKSTALAKSPFLNAAFPDAFSSSSSSSMMMDAFFDGDFFFFFFFFFVFFNSSSSWEKRVGFFVKKKKGWSRHHSRWDARLTPQIREEGVGVPFFSIIIIH